MCLFSFFLLSFVPFTNWYLSGSLIEMLAKSKSNERPGAMISLQFVQWFAIFVILLRDNRAEENLFKSTATWAGLMKPNDVDATIGEDVYLRIDDPPTNQIECLFRKTGQSDGRPPKDK